MTPTKMITETRCIGKPLDWNEAEQGECLALSVTDVPLGDLNYMVSHWLPDAEELARINAGEPIALWIQGIIHPVVALSS